MCRNKGCIYIMYLCVRVLCVSVCLSVCLQLLPLCHCHVSECQQMDFAELAYCGIKVDYRNADEEVETFILQAGSVNKKAEWIADVTQVRVHL